MNYNVKHNKDDKLESKNDIVKYPQYKEVANVKSSHMCKELHDYIQEKQVVNISIHSRFNNAINFQLEDGTLFTILSIQKTHQPFSVVIDNFQLTDLGDLPDEMLMLPDGLYSNNTKYIDFSDSEIVDLALSEVSDIPEINIDRIRSFLFDRQEKGICGLANGIANNVYSQFLEDRINRFREAYDKDLLEKIQTAVKGLAGCGPGLTPSSDDFLCGYIAAYTGTDDKKEVIKEIAKTAAGRTNDVSASLLKHAGNGLFSFDVIKLMKALERDDESKIEETLKRVANFGSSSGCDFLTGLYFGLIDKTKKGR